MGLLCLSGLTFAQPEAASFQGGWAAEWHYAKDESGCSLGLDLIEYGRARFAVGQDREMTFELQALRDAQFGDVLDARSRAPGWHPAAGRERALGTLQHIQGGGLTARGALARRLLMQLQAGYLIEIVSPAWFDAEQKVQLQLTPQSLRPALNDFLACAKSAISVSWAHMSRTRIAYAVDEHALDDAAAQHLAAVAQFIAADPSVTTIYVDGHTDASGDKRHNHALAKRRATTVTKFLAERGVSEARMVTRYHGANYPVADNKSVQGKAKNRRTTVRLERDDPQNIAQQ